MVEKYMSGVFVNEVKIVSVVPTYEGKEWQKQYKDDVGLDITLDIGRDFQPVMYIGGSLKKDDFGEVQGVGSAVKVKLFFDELGIKLDDQELLTQSINEDRFNSVQGMSFQRLSYVTKRKENGKLQYSDFQNVLNVNKPKSELIDKFKESVSNGWIKSYKPELMQEQSPKFAEQEISDW
tara:strand:- start:3290 stop:3826 length:537 start_codon:yes stop_codon:yes gene_type:complete